MGARPRDPPPAAQLAEVEGGRGRFAAARGFGTTGTHGDGLLETPHFRAAGGAEEVDVAQALVVLGEPGHLLVHAGARRRRLAVETLEHLAVPRGELTVVVIARLVEEPQDVGRTQVLDLLHAHQRGVAALALDLLGQPLEVLVALRCVGQQVGRALQGHRPQRA